MRSSSIDAALTAPAPFAALLFDCDGTLVDSATAYERAWERAFASLEAVGILGLFDAVVTVEDVERGKPAPDLYLVALDRLRVAAADCVAYEDTDEGLAAAKAAGIRCIDVRPVPATGLDPPDEPGDGR
jgi:beta-phosphoglucomutase-like phosphatase (HAD superfamily)